MGYPPSSPLSVPQEAERWSSFLHWNEHKGVFGDHDLVGFGDVDEIPSRDNVQYLRYCEMGVSSVDIGSWFAFGRLDLAFSGDHPIRGNPWTVGDPTYWTIAAARVKGDPSRMRGTSPAFLEGGIHMTDNGYLPFKITKFIACSDCGSD